MGITMYSSQAKTKRIERDHWTGTDDIWNWKFIKCLHRQCSMVQLHPRQTWYCLSNHFFSAPPSLDSVKWRMGNGNEEMKKKDKKKLSTQTESAWFGCECVCACFFCLDMTACTVQIPDERKQGQNGGKKKERKKWATSRLKCVKINKMEFIHGFFVQISIQFYKCFDNCSSLSPSLCSFESIGLFWLTIKYGWK